ncbi:MAG: GMC family oxidoreductase [Caldilineaceae bacterium]|nr:GMC family oxidoreductase [Caldilineaceae bacterium]
MKRAIVVGSGAGGATVAKELQGKFAVTVLEAGQAFQPFSWELSTLERLKENGLLFDARAIRLLFPTMRIRKTPDMLLVNGKGLGGTTTICTGNALRMDQELQRLGFNLDAEFAEIYQEIPISTVHQKRWHKPTRHLFEICQELALEPQPTPKMGDYKECISCGRCVLGCPQGAKWDSRRFLQAALDRGAQLATGCQVERVIIEAGKATGVVARQGLRRRFFPADLVILAAGGLGTPVILQNSGIPCEPRLFVDPVLTVAAYWPNALQCKEIAMPFVVQREHFMISPYFDYLSFCFNRTWRHPAKDMLGMMIKLADANVGSISRRTVEKRLTLADRQWLHTGVELCKEIFHRLGVKERDIVLGTINAGHPGGMLPLTAAERHSLHSARLPANLYVADATLLPRSLGNPPILTIIALAKRVSRVCTKVWA